MRSLDNLFKRLSSSTVVENCLAMLKSVSPGRTLYVFDPAAVVALAVADGRDADADGRDEADRAGIMSSCLAEILPRADKAFASRSSFDVIPYFRATEVTVSPFFTVWNLKVR